MARRKYPQIKGRLYTKSEKQGNGASYWSMIAAEDGNHYKCADCNLASMYANPEIEGYLKIMDGNLYFFTV